MSTVPPPGQTVDLKQFADLYRKMRRAQEAYFRARRSPTGPEHDKALLILSKRLEAELDALAGQILDPNLLTEEPASHG